MASIETEVEPLTEEMIEAAKAELVETDSEEARAESQEARADAQKARADNLEAEVARLRAALAATPPSDPPVG